MGFEQGLDWTWERAIQSMSLSLSLSLSIAQSISHPTRPWLAPGRGRASRQGQVGSRCCAPPISSTEMGLCLESKSDFENMKWCLLTIWCVVFHQQVVFCTSSIYLGFLCSFIFFFNLLQRLHRVNMSSYYSSKLSPVGGGEAAKNVIQKNEKNRDENCTK